MCNFLYNMQVATPNGVELRFHYDKDSAATYSSSNVDTCRPKILKKKCSTNLDILSSMFNYVYVYVLS